MTDEKLAEVFQDMEDLFCKYDLTNMESISVIEFMKFRIMTETFDVSTCMRESN